MSRNPEMKDRIICAWLYTGVFCSALCWVPIIWVLFYNIKKIPMRDFVKYHCYQSILFNMICFALPDMLKLITEFIANLLSITVIFENSASLLVSLVNWIIGVYHIIIKVIAVYGFVWTLRGRFTYLPPISQAVNLLLR